jgi:hypothetical protein
MPVLPLRRNGVIRPQAIINKQLLYKCDLLVAIFWTRLGTATGEAASGTVEEITRHVAAGKTAMVYFSNTPVSLATVDQQQYAAVTAFRKECKGNGLFHEFVFLEQFRDDFRRHLELTIQDEFNHDKLADQLDFATPTRQDSNLSKEAQELLVQASKDSSGSILWLSSMSGLQIQTNDQTFVEAKNARSEAKWRAAIKQLEQSGLIEWRSDSMCSITTRGYEVADYLGHISPL